MFKDVLALEDVHGSSIYICTIYLPGCIIVGAELHFADVKGSYIYLLLFFSPSFPVSAASTRLHTFFVHVRCSHRRGRVSPGGTRNLTPPPPTPHP
jgi:hypothetical protein